MLTPEQISAARQASGYSALQPSTQNTGLPSTSLSSRLGIATAAQPEEDMTRANQATFPATGDESIPGIAGKTLGNLPESTYEFGKGLVNFLNPLNAVKSAQELGTGIGEYQNDVDAHKQAPVSVMDVAKEIPGTAYKMLVPLFLQHIFAGDTKKAAATIENDPVGQIAPLLFMARGVASAAGKGAEFDTAISSIAKPVTAPASAIGSGVGEVAKGAGRFLGGQLTGLSPDTIGKILADPQAFSKEAEQSYTRPALAKEVQTAIEGRQSELADTGKEYAGIRTTEQNIPVEPDYLTKLVQSKTGLTMGEDGKLVSSGSASVRLPADISALQSKLIDVWQPEFAKGYLTPNEYLNFRSDLGKMAYNDSGIGKSTALANLADIMRGQSNTDIRPNIPGLEALDKQFAPQQTELTDITKGLVDKDGNLTDAAVNRIANATGKGKNPQLDRLEQLSPGITDKIKIMKAVEDIQNSREVKVGTYLRAGALGAGLVTLNPYLIISAIASIPEVAVPLLRGLGISADKATSIIKMLGLDKANTGTAETSVKLAPGATAEENQQVQ